MCGRCFCTLEPTVLSKACNYKDSSGKFKQTPWISSNDKNNYKPSSNFGPRDYLPIIVSGNHFQNEENRILIPMLWGMVPSTWTEDPRKHRANTHNARIETIEQTMYKDSLTQGCRCIVVIEGIYEWKTTGNDKSKQPYGIYMCQDNGIQIDDPSSWSDDWTEEKGWQGIKVLKLAGLFKKTKNIKTGEITYSFSIITRESNSVLSWLHHRMPIILSNSDDEEMWLNYKKFSKAEALMTIRKMSLNDGIITWHPVSTSVNDVRNKQADLIKPVKPKQQNETKKMEKHGKAEQFMMSWLKRKSDKIDAEKCNTSDNNEQNSPKRHKKCDD